MGFSYMPLAKPQDASGAAALAQALLEGGLIAIEVGGVDTIRW